MVKFKVLRNNQTYMSYLGIYSNRLTEPTNEFFKSIGCYLNVTAMVTAFIGCTIFVSKYHSSDMRGALGSFKLCFSASQCLGAFLGIGLNMIKVKALHLELQRIVDDAAENADVLNIYWNCEKKCRKQTMAFVYYVPFHVSTYIIVLIYAVYCIANGNYDTSHWYLAMNMSLPFDLSRVDGWFLTCIVQLLMATSYAMCMTSFTSYFVSCCYYLSALSDHFNVLIDCVTKKIQSIQMAQGSIEAIGQEIHIDLCNIIKFQMRIYEIFYMLAKISTVSIFVIFPANVIFLSISMYDVEMSIRHFKAYVLLFAISCTLCGLLWPAFLCYFASHASDRIASFGAAIYNSNWMDYPPHLQKYVILIIIRSQESVYFTGLGIVRCTLEVFSKLCKTSASYYIMFRALGRR